MKKLLPWDKGYGRKKCDNYTARNRMTYLTFNEWHQGDIKISLNFEAMIENSALEGNADVS